MTSTPPPSTLSTPSPTEQETRETHKRPTPSTIPSLNTLQKMNHIAPKKPITLIVATAVQPHLGIGLSNQLPWPSIRSDMTFFRRTTTGTPSPRLNAVVMGRKTYESIPSKFRPLSDRVNVVLTRRDVRGVADRVLRELVGQGEPAEYRLVDRETVDGLNGQVVGIYRRDHEQATVVVTDSLVAGVEVEAENVYCIGGAEVYAAVLRERELRGRARVLQTEVRKREGEWECDTFWPEELSEGNGWREVGKEEVKEWTGVEVPQGEGEWVGDEKVGVDIRVVGWERIDGI